MLDGVHAKVAELNDRILPRGMRIENFYDRTLLVGNTLKTVNSNLLHGFLLVVAVAWLFFRSITGSLIVAAVIPLALLGAFIGLYILKLPANLISMGAIDFGILVDGAVVLVENVLHAVQHERPAQRRDVLRLIIRAAEQVARPTLYAMLIIIAALVPVFTLEQVEGRIFRPLALTYSFALVAALVLALTLVPALCAIGFAARAQRVGAALARSRACALRRLARVPAGAPPADRAGRRIVLRLERRRGRAPGHRVPARARRGRHPGVRRNAAQHRAGGGADHAGGGAPAHPCMSPEVTQVLSENGRPEDGTDNENPNMSETFVRLKPRDQWRAGYDKRRLPTRSATGCRRFPGVRYNFSQPIKDNVEEAVAGVRGKVVLKVFGTETRVMRDTLEQARLKLASVPGIVDLGLYRDATVPQLQVKLDREAVARAGLTVAAVNDFIGTALAGKVVTTFWEGERPVPIRLMIPVSARENDQRDRRARRAAARRRQRAAARPAADQRGHRRGEHLPRSQQPLPRAQVQRRGPRHGLRGAGRHRDRRRRASRCPTATTSPGAGSSRTSSAPSVGSRSSCRRRSPRCWRCSTARSNPGAPRSPSCSRRPFAMTGGVFALMLGGMPLSVSAVVGFIALLGQVSLLGLLLVSAIEARRSSGDDLLDARWSAAAWRSCARC